MSAAYGFQSFNDLRIVVCQNHGEAATRYYGGMDVQRDATQLSIPGENGHFLISR